MNRILAVVALSVSSMLGAPLHAGSSCEVYTYSHGTPATTGGARKQLEIIKSWLPEQLLINNENIQFANRTPIEIDSKTARKIRASVQSKDSEGNRLYTVYEIVMKDGGKRAWVTMRVNRYKPLGPVIYDCETY